MRGVKRAGLPTSRWHINGPALSEFAKSNNRSSPVSIGVIGPHAPKQWDLQHKQQWYTATFKPGKTIMSTRWARMS